MIDHETIAFELHLAADYWHLPPLVEIFVDQVKHYQGAITDATTSASVIRFSHDLKFGNSHELVIQRFGKSDDQFRINSDGVAQDQLLLIQKLVIDGVNIRDIVWRSSFFEPNYPEPWATEQKDLGLELQQRVYGETVLGHNGKWTLSFTSPFYQFLIRATEEPA